MRLDEISRTTSVAIRPYNEYNLVVKRLRYKSDPFCLKILPCRFDKTETRECYCPPVHFLKVARSILPCRITEIFTKRLNATLPLHTVTQMASETLTKVAAAEWMVLTTGKRSFAKRVKSRDVFEMPASRNHGYTSECIAVKSQVLNLLT